MLFYEPTWSNENIKNSQLLYVSKDDIKKIIKRFQQIGIPTRYNYIKVNNILTSNIQDMIAEKIKDDFKIPKDFNDTDSIVFAIIYGFNYIKSTSINNRQLINFIYNYLNPFKYTNYKNLMQGDSYRDNYEKILLAMSKILAKPNNNLTLNISHIVFQERDLIKFDDHEVAFNEDVKKDHDLFQAFRTADTYYGKGISVKERIEEGIDHLANDYYPTIIKTNDEEITKMAKKIENILSIKREKIIKNIANIPNISSVVWSETSNDKCRCALQIKTSGPVSLKKILRIISHYSVPAAINDNQLAGYGYLLSLEK